MNHAKRLGIFAKIPTTGAVKTRLTPPLTPESAAALYTAFLRDLFRRLGRLKGARVSVFYAGDELEALSPLAPDHWEFVSQSGRDLGERMAAAFETLLRDAGRAVIIGSDSPDIPVQYIRRAFQRLKHKDIALGPTIDGGYYLVGLRSPTPGLFEGVHWGSDTVLAETLANIGAHRLSLSVLPVWYDVDDAPTLRFLESMVEARRLEGRDRLGAVEAALEALRASRASGG